MIDPTKVQDQITGALEFWETKREIEKLKTPQRERILGLKYTPGMKVVDSVSGEEVEVIGGIREIIGLPGPGSEGR